MSQAEKDFSTAEALSREDSQRTCPDNAKRLRDQIGRLAASSDQEREAAATAFAQWWLDVARSIDCTEVPNAE